MMEVNLCIIVYGKFDSIYKYACCICVLDNTNITVTCNTVEQTIGITGYLITKSYAINNYTQYSPFLLASQIT